MTRHILRGVFLMILFGLILAGCRNEIEEYYERPEWLEPPIYDNLKEKGNFSSYLACVDKAGYGNILGKAGYFTVFAPTDEAFSAFLSENGYSSTDDIDEETAQRIVKYSIVYNAYNRERIDDFQSTTLLDWDPDKAFKRQTAYYKWVHREEVNGMEENVFDQNGVPLLPEQNPIFNSEDNNNKHIPYFTDQYFQTKSLTAYDYNYFFPSSEFVGFNVADAGVIEEDIQCENGIVHAVDRVILPLENLEAMLASNPEYSEFKRILDEYVVEYEIAPQGFLNRYEQVSGNREDVYIKYYPLMNFAPNCENYMKYGGGQTYDAQTDGWTLFAPNNAAVTEFFNNKFLVKYKSLDNMSPQIISEFINAHMFRTTVWPSKFATTSNMFGEPARFDPASNIIEKQFGSNGVFYGTNIIQKTDAFYTILGDIILDPEYSTMLQALLTTELYYIVKNTSLYLTIFLIKNEAFENIGLTFDSDRNTWNLDNPNLGTNSNLALTRLIKMHMVLTTDLSDLSGDGIIETYGGDYIRYNGGFIWGAGNVQQEQTVFVSGKARASNGMTYKLNRPLAFSIDNIGREIEGKAQFSRFYEYLLKSAEAVPVNHVYDTLNKAITNIASTEDNTLFIPNNAAMQAAIDDGMLPVIGFADFTVDQQNKVLAFVMYHIIAKSIVVPDGKISGVRDTYHKTEEGKATVTVINQPGSFSLIDANGRTANVVMENSNILSNRAVIHQLDNYLKY
ncbi:MAG: fasciclin domain-containing protein [Bacteroidales bacterium]|nr:fasciclin domain-containing protein [Bacteroidales bacterium]MBN2697195.1 fasciclin domain-containing protein [Bacteroidales bacterium]